MLLYHGSKSGIDGPIQPISRDRCDFGRGFYMGTEESQPLTLICNYPQPKLYTLDLELEGLSVLNLQPDLTWALVVAYNRAKMESVKDTQLYQQIQRTSTGHDVIVGPIANDRMFVVLDRFFNAEITDIALVNSLSALNLGSQYVAVTQKACDQIRIVGVRELSESDRQKLKTISEQNRAEGVSLAESICRKYRREGRFFDEILAEGARI